MIRNFIERFFVTFPNYQYLKPWEITNQLREILNDFILTAGQDYYIKEGIAIHKTATIEQNVVLNPPVVICGNCLVRANAYLRGPVYLDESVSVGAGCEIKQSIIFSHSAIAHFNYIGNSIIGSQVNFEAGSVAANHYNEKSDKNIFVVHNSEIINTHTSKFGALVGDHSRIGANAVLSPGTLLLPHSIVKRLELVDQLGHS